MVGLGTIARFLAVVDGLAAWQEMAREIERTLDDPLRGLPVLAGFAGFFLLVWLNVRLARWLLTRTK